VRKRKLRTIMARLLARYTQAASQVVFGACLSLQCLKPQANSYWNRCLLSSSTQVPSRLRRLKLRQYRLERGFVYRLNGHFLEGRGMTRNKGNGGFADLKHLR
jgi:hypothetical protein